VAVQHALGPRPLRRKYKSLKKSMGPKNFSCCLILKTQAGRNALLLVFSEVHFLFYGPFDKLVAVVVADRNANAFDGVRIFGESARLA
jgi:hypothetical protein